MRHRFAVLLLTGAILQAAPTAAGPITEISRISITQAGSASGMHIDFGLESFRFHEAAWMQPIGPGNEPPPTIDRFPHDVWITFEAPDLLREAPWYDEVTGVHESTLYEYGPGRVWVTAHSTGELLLTAKTEAFWFDVWGEDETFKTEEGCYYCPYAPSNINVLLGPGRLEAAFAALLGVSQRTIGGYLWMGAEDIYRNPNGERGAFTNGAGMSVSTTVPEPGLLALALIGAVGYLAKRTQLRPWARRS